MASCDGDNFGLTDFVMIGLAREVPAIVAIDINTVKSRILEIRNQQVLLDRDVAALYGVETRVINQAVKNNEVEVLRSKILTLEAKPGKGHYSKHGYKVFCRKRVVDGDQLPHRQAQAHRVQGQEGEIRQSGKL